MKLFWGESLSPASLHSTYYVTRLNFIIAKAEARHRGSVEYPLGLNE